MHNQQRYIDLVEALCSLPSETEWVEFKVDNSDPSVIGKRVSALSNGARLKDKSCGYLVYGVKDKTHEVVGTEFRPSTQKTKGQPLAFWLAQQLNPHLALNFVEVAHPKGRVVLIEVPAASGVPTKFEGTAFIRIGEATPRLDDYPLLESQLWARLQSHLWERDVALEYLSADRVVDLLDTGKLFDLLRLPRPVHPSQSLQKLEAEGLIAKDVGGKWNILNLGAALIARDIEQFPRLSRKRLRVIEYTGTSRVDAKPEATISGGYAAIFDDTIDLIMRITARENIGTLRLNSQPVPRVAVRELVANCLIHQDMSLTGSGPTVEIFSDRIEITNPGRPLIDPARFLDMPPRSRNEALAATMRRMNICEERGSGIDRVIKTIEETHLPAPDFPSGEDFTRAILLGPRDFSTMTATERMRACYQHAALLNEQGQRATNASLRARFGLPKTNSAQVSRVFKDAREANLIKLADPAAPNAGYVPHFAGQTFAPVLLEEPPPPVKRKKTK